MNRMILDERLFESKLFEAFSPSMPMWLQDRLMYQKTDRYGRKFTNKRANLLSKGRNVDAMQRSTGVGQSRSYYSNRGDSTPLYDIMIRKGLNLDKAKFISGDVPTNGRDERVKEPNIPIFHIVIAKDDGFSIGNDFADGPVDTVYVKGYNDDEKLGNSEVLFKYLSFKQLVSMTKDFCYIDGSDTENFNTDTKSSRDKIKAELSKIPNYDRKTRADWGQKLDKSGYIIDPQKYKKKLIELGRQDVQKTLNKYYSRIMRLKNEFASILLNHDVSDRDDSDFKDIFSTNGSELMRQLVRVMQSYNTICKEVERAMASDTEEEKNNRLDIIFGSDAWGPGDIKVLADNISDIERSAARVLRAEVDWDTEDYID